ncbi:MAG: serine/threonine-protein kinase PknK, partial [Anaerolineae bacterium]|nr:serine/threonine-protein kinase PknK [Anaerolineae bacterium]
MDDLIGRTIGSYLVVEVLGEGGMATVYKAFHSRLERYVALKFIHPDLIHDLAAFEREARLLARLSHPNIVQIYDYGEEEGRPFLVIEYVAGGTLRDWLAEEGTLSLDRALPILRHVADALDHAHGQSIVHRDVKPSNVMLTPDGRALLADFGISRLTGPEGHITQTETTTGTPAYMSPEQVTPQLAPVGPRSDVYSLGIVVYEMLTGHLPFAASSPLEAIVLRLQEPPVPPRTHNPDLPEAVERAVLRALAKDPEGRYPGAGAFVEALAQAEPGASAAAVAQAEAGVLPAWWPRMVVEPEPALGEPPFKGLQAFDVADAGLFFGREALVERLVGRLKGGGRFLAIVGASGSGKSSLVRAGLAAALQSETSWEIQILTPTAHPLKALAASLAPDADTLRSTTTLVDDLAADPRSLHMYVRGSLRSSPNRRLLFVLDQFEELLTLCRDPAERQAFVDNLLTAAT